jgi:hypothetical protein
MSNPSKISRQPLGQHDDVSGPLGVGHVNCLAAHPDRRKQTVGPLLKPTTEPRHLVAQLGTD